MVKILLISRESSILKELGTFLVNESFSCVKYDSDKEFVVSEVPTDFILAIVELGSSSNEFRSEFFSEKLPELREEKKIPIIALISKNMIPDFESQLYVDDFIIEPYNFTELLTRMKRILNRVVQLDGSETIKSGDLVIDIAKCEVYLRNRLISLTFTEYELLKFLAKNRGRVFSRDALLNEVWGYDYFGGDRTVDVHIRRLRNKIEDLDHTFIETVRNIGYKFKETVSINT